jgi:uncharacterized protein (DUF2141 family)
MCPSMRELFGVSEQSFGTSKIMKLKKSIELILLFLILFPLYCAKEGMPPGGPEDTTPPEVISVSPEANSTGVDLNSMIEITFSERMSNKPTEESIFISPFPKKLFDYKWRGEKLILSFSEPLQENKTYVVTIGTGAQDLRRNHLSESYTSAFSTGPALDHGSISGEVWLIKEDRFQTEPGISIWAYLSGSEYSEPISDTILINLQKDIPDYVTQSDTGGKYIFRNLSVGKYRLFAVDDLNRDQVWDPDKEAIGVSTRDVELASSKGFSNQVDFIVALRDTTKPSLLNCQALNKNQVRLDFDENLKVESVLNPANFKIVSFSTTESLQVNEVYFQEGNTQYISISTAEMSPDEEYELKVFSLEDEWGNPLDTSANTCLFVGSEVSDTTGPRIVATSPKDDETNVPQDEKIKLAFDEPPSHSSVESSFFLSDSNDALISGKSRWENPNTFVFSPDTLLLGRVKYQIKLQSEKVLDLLGNTMTDSVWLLTFTTLNPDTLGSLSGLVLTFVPKDSVRGKARPEGSVQISVESTSEKIVVTLSLIDKSQKKYQKSLPQPGSFSFEKILPGKYIVGAYVDLDKNGELTIGNPKPFILCEPFTFFPDTVYVRSRWETEGVELKFR